MVGPADGMRIADAISQEAEPTVWAATSAVGFSKQEAQNGAELRPHPLAVAEVLNVRAEVPGKSGQLGLEDRLCPRAVLHLPPPGRHLPSLGRLRQGNCVVAAVGPYPFAFMATFGCPRCVLAPTLAQRSPGPSIGPARSRRSARYWRLLRIFRVLMFSSLMHRCWADRGIFRRSAEGILMPLPSCLKWHTK